MLSIVVPVYNVERYLRQCIESVLMQSCADWELILVDDGSKDSSGAICDEYAARDGRIRVIHKENEGVSVARNVGIEAAKGEFISFIDSDDWVEETYVEVLTQSAQRCDISFFGVTIHQKGENDRQLKPISSLSENAVFDYEEKILSLKSNRDNFEYFGYSWDKVFKRALLEKYNIRFIKGLSVREDELFAMDYCQRISSINILSDCLYNYRMLSSSLTSIAKNVDQLTLFINYFEKKIGEWQSERIKLFDSTRLVDFYTERSVSNRKIYKALDSYATSIAEIRRYNLRLFGIKQNLLYSTGLMGYFFFVAYYVIRLIKK